MTIAEAVKKLNEKVPGFTPIGYWKQPDGYVFNTRPDKLYQGCEAPTLYVVKNDGRVYGTNPMRDNVNPSAMKQL